MTACTCAPVYGWRNRLVGYAQDHACTLHGRKKVEIMIPIAVPTLDARTADHVAGFLHWLQIAVQRVHNVKNDPYWCVADAVEAAEGSARYANLHGYDHFVVCNT